MVTAELAVALPAVVLVLTCALLGVGAAVDQVRCVDAARVAARAAARGDEPGRVREVGQLAAPAGASISVTRSRGRARVEVSVRSGGWGGLLPSWDVSATAISPLEDAGP